jgi:UDP-GlcNAc:undecaprenyl-phosphate GlcNAc-1-phosphate transferase
VNAVNLIDGLDGLAGGVAVIALASIFGFSLIRGDALMMFTCASLAGAVLGFLFFNFNPARIFMGDTGSMFLGFILAVTSLMSSEKSPTVVALLAPAMVLALPLGDTSLAIVRRWLHRRPIFDADRGHVHHRLLAAGFTQRQAVLLLYGMCAFFGAMAQLIWVANDTERVVIVACVAALAFMFARRLGCLKPVIDEPTLVDAATLLFVPQQELARARSEDEIWRLVCRYATVAGACSVSATFARTTGSVVYSTTLTSGASGNEYENATGTFAGDALRSLHLVWSDGAMNRSLCKVWVHALGRSVEEAAQRLGRRDEAALNADAGPSHVRSAELHSE